MLYVLVIVGGISACSSPTAPVVQEQYFIKMVHKVDSLAVPGQTQTVAILEARTNVPADSGQVHWVSDFYWTAPSYVPGQTDTIPTINSFSYPSNGVVRQTFAANKPFAGMTATVTASITMNGKLVADTMYIKMY